MKITCSVFWYFLLSLWITMIIDICLAFYISCMFSHILLCMIFVTSLHRMLRPNAYSVGWQWGLYFQVLPLSNRVTDYLTFLCCLYFIYIKLLLFSFCFVLALLEFLGMPLAPSNHISYYRNVRQGSFQNCGFAHLLLQVNGALTSQGLGCFLKWYKYLPHGVVRI